MVRMGGKVASTRTGKVKIFLLPIRRPNVFLVAQKLLNSAWVPLQPEASARYLGRQIILLPDFGFVALRRAGFGSKGRTKGVATKNKPLYDAVQPPHTTPCLP